MQKANTELETSPLIEELKRRTEANKQKNAQQVKDASIAYNSGVVSDGNVKMVRYQGAQDALPVTRMMGAEQIKELEKLGYNLNCPSWGGACTLTGGKVALPFMKVPPALVLPFVKVQGATGGG